jgi:GNAT superfamily N-acetyltransferase
MTRLAFAEEKVSDAWDEAVALMRANHEETGAGDGEDFKPNRARYEEFWELGLIRAYTARWEGALVGYALFFVTPHLHYPEWLTAQQDVLYVQPSCRGRGAVRFIRWMDDSLKAEGVKLVIRAVSARLDYSRTLERMGYKPLEQVFRRFF